MGAVRRGVRRFFERERATAAVLQRKALCTVAWAVAVVLVIGVGAPLSATSAQRPLRLATATVGDCNSNGVPDLYESSWANRDDDRDGFCNSVDVCPYEFSAVNDASACQMQAITVPADPTDFTVPHATYSGANITLKGIARYGGNQFMWDYGDGSQPMVWTAFADPYNLGVQHVYTGAVGTTYTATLSVRNSAAPAVVATARYVVRIEDGGSSPSTTVLTQPQYEVRREMAIDAALWYLHVNVSRSRFGDGSPGFSARYAIWNQNAQYFPGTCAAVDALENFGSRPNGSYDADPYLEDVERGLNYMLYNSQANTVTAQQEGNPDVNGNGLGITVVGGSDIGADSSCAAALADSQAPDDVAISGPRNVYGRTFADIAQDAVDWLAYAQNDTGAGNDYYGGDWGYTANSEGYALDLGYQFLPSLALRDSVAELGATVPTFVSTGVAHWLAEVHHTSTDQYNGGWGMETANDWLMDGNTASGMLEEEFLGVPATDAAMGAGVGFLYRHWDGSSNQSSCWGANIGDTWTMWPVSLALRGASPSYDAVTGWDYSASPPAVTAAHFDWFYSAIGQVQEGYVRDLVTRQASAGSWTDTIGCMGVAGIVGTALDAMILMKVTPPPNTGNHSPAWQSPTPASGTVVSATPAQPVTINVAAVDPDAADTVTIHAPGAPADAAFASTPGNPATATLTWTPPTSGSTTLTFTAADGHGGAASQELVIIDASKQRPTISWSTPADIVYGTSLDGTQLNASLSTDAGAATPPHPGTFAFTPDTGAVLPAGNDTLSVTWTPDPADATNWEPVTATVTLHVNQAPQTLTFDPPIDDSTTYTYGDPPFTVNAVSDRGLAITYSVGADDDCTSAPQSDGSTQITITGAGPCAVSADQAGNGNYLAAPTISHSLTIAAQTPAMSLAPAGMTYGGQLGAGQMDAVVSPADAAANGTVTYAVDGIAVAAGDVVHAGQHTLVATYTPATSDYRPTSATATFNVTQATQTIDFASLLDRTVGDAAFSVSGTASSGLLVTFSSATPDVCTVTDGSVTVLHHGTCRVDATQAGDNDYEAADTVEQSFDIAPASQAISFTQPDDQTYGASPVTLSASGGGSGNPVTFTASPVGICSIDGSERLEIDGAGDCTLTARQAGSDDYNAATDVAHTITIDKATPAITWPAPADISYGAALGTDQLDAGVAPAGISGTFAYTLADGTTATGAVLHASSTPQTLNVTFTPTGGDAGNWYPASSSATITVHKADQTITWTQAPTAATYGDSPFTVAATGGASGNPVVFTAESGSACTVNGDTVTITAIGACVIDANQAGDSDYNAAPTATTSVTVAKRTPDITWAPPAHITYGTPVGAAQLDATASPAEAASAGSLAYTSDGGSRDANGLVLHAGTHTLTATYTPDASSAGDNFTSASKNISLVVDQAAQTISSFDPIGTQTYGDGPITLSAAGGGSGNAVYFSVSAGGACATSGTHGTMLTITGAGSCTVVAHQDGNSDYYPAPDMSQTFQILQALQTISFAALPTAYVGDPAIALSATGGGSDNPVTFAAGPTATCVLSGPTTLTITGPGTCLVTAGQAGNANFRAASSVARSFDVTYRICVLTDPTQSHPSGSVVPIRVALCNGAGTSTSSAAIALHANGVDGGAATAPGGSQPGNNFRFTSAGGGSYQYNLQTTGLTAGTHRFRFTVAGDPDEHTLSLLIT